MRGTAFLGMCGQLLRRHGPGRRRGSARRHYGLLPGAGWPRGDPRCVKGSPAEARPAVAVKTPQTVRREAAALFAQRSDIRNGPASFGAPSPLSFFEEREKEWRRTRRLQQYGRWHTRIFMAWKREMANGEKLGTALLPARAVRMLGWF